jgi:hypothetical protein
LFHLGPPSAAPQPAGWGAVIALEIKSERLVGEMEEIVKL